MADLENHAARLGRVGQFHRVADAAQAHPFHRLALRLVEPDRAPHQRDLQLLRGGLRRCLLGHDYAPTSSASSLPRQRATSAGSFRSISPLNVARTTLCGFAEPSDLVSTFWMPHDSTTARTAPPAMRPVPSGAGLSRTLPEPNLPTTWCGIVVPLSGTRMRLFFAASMPFLIAEGTSFALPTPKPTTPWPSPTTTSALKLRFLPPLTTLVTRLMLTTVSLRSSCDASIFSRVSIIRTPALLRERPQPPHGSGRD